MKTTKEREKFFVSIVTNRRRRRESAHLRERWRERLGDKIRDSDGKLMKSIRTCIVNCFSR